MERFGTRWVVWVGGLALALGGVFMVRYSIEQGWIGPGVRVGLGALLAAALVVAGEWLRRSERRLDIAGISAANIPSILTAAGTTVAYATVWAAYALYGFLDPPAAFVLLGSSRWSRSARRCCTVRRWRRSASSAPKLRRCSSPPTRRIIGRSTSILRS